MGLSVGSPLLSESTPLGVGRWKTSVRLLQTCPASPNGCKVTELGEERLPRGPVSRVLAESALALRLRGSPPPDVRVSTIVEKLSGVERPWEDWISPSRLLSGVREVSSPIPPSGSTPFPIPIPPGLGPVVILNRPGFLAESNAVGSECAVSFPGLRSGDFMSGTMWTIPFPSVIPGRNGV